MATEETRNDAREPRDGFAEVMTRVSPAWHPAVAAREFAAAGVPVFPCAPGGKRPVTENGFHDATTEARQVDVWWRARPGANIGMPTGEVSGVVVVDVDVHGPVNGYGSMRRAQQAGLVDGWMFLVATPSGGTHAYYPAVPGQQQRSWQAARAAVDFRGDGGYIVLPPSSVLVNGARAGYRLQQLGSGPSAPPINSVHGYHAERCPPRATTATVATTMIPSTMSGQAHDCPAPIPERAARSARAVKLNQNAPAAMNTVPTAAVSTAHRRSIPAIMTALRMRVLERQGPERERRSRRGDPASAPWPRDAQHGRRSGRS